MAEQHAEKPSDVRINIDISDEDIYDAMNQVPGYIDITTEDFYEVYRLAHDHALHRLVRALHVRDVMQRELVSVAPEMRLDEAAKTMAAHRLKSVPVVDNNARVVGMLSEKDYLKKLGVSTFMEFLIRYLTESAEVNHEYHETRVEAIMGMPPITVPEDGTVLTILHAFKTYAVRRIPVVDDLLRLRGIISRKDFVHACHLETIT